ncbi:MAG: hypothetical protein QOH01_456 [Verrucomicrobiota bacterium]|jgi:hypothetical protein
MGGSPDRPPPATPAYYGSQDRTLLELSDSELLFHMERFRERTRYYGKLRSEAETKVIQSLFVLNTGIFAAVVGRSTTGPLARDLLISLFASAAGILLLLVRAACSYYRVDFKFSRPYSMNVDAFERNQLGLVSLYARDRERAGGSQLLHGLAVLSGILLLLAAGFGLKGIIDASHKLAPTRQSVLAMASAGAL